MSPTRLSSLVRSIVGLSLVSVVFGCGGAGGPDAAVTVDSGGPQDAGGVDAGGVDAGGVDAGGADAGGVDAGGVDAGGVDAGGADAGGFDAGAFDAGVSDAGFDAGVADAGSSSADAGLDAGPAVGCSSGSQCASGICLGTGCFNCQSDAECGTGERCGTGVCSASCVNATSCAPGQDCCGGRCVDPQRDPFHCGQCGQACTASEFCGRAACRPADFSQVCELPIATVMLDEIAEDDDAGLSMGAALASACAPPPALRTAGQDDAGVLRIADGAPLALGELLVMGGGSFRQDAVRWLETTNTAPVRDTSTTADAIYSLRDGGVASTVPFTTLGPTRDRVLVQLVRTPSGALVLNAAGYFGTGTLAASWYFAQQILPMRASLTTSWYVIEWEDLDATGGPTAADRYTLIASGS